MPQARLSTHLCWNAPPGVSKGQCVKDLFAEIQAGYQRHGTTSKLNALRLSMFNKPDSFACLSATAAETRCLVPVLADITRADVTGKRMCHTHLCLAALTDFLQNHGECRLPAW